MKRTLVLWTVIAALALAGCSKEEEGGGGTGGNTGGGTGTGSGNLAVVAAVAQDLSYAELYDTLGNPILDAEVRINGTLLNPVGNGVYMTTSVTYAKGTTYTLEINAGEYGTAQASVTAPNIDSLKITQPADGAQIDPNTEITVTWEYYGGENNGLVGLSLDYSTDTTTYESGILAGSTTSHTIPAAATALEGEASITVMAGDYAVIEGLPDPDPTDPFEGSLFGVFTGDAVDLVIGSGGGGGDNQQWAGTLTGTVDGNTADGYWYYPFESPLANVVFYVSTGTDTLFFGGNTSTWPPQDLNLMSQDLATTMTISGELVGQDSIVGTWQMNGAHTGSGTWTGGVVNGR